MRENEVLEMLSLNTSRPIQAQRLKLIDFFYIGKTETVEVRGPLGLWGFPALNTFLFNIRKFIKMIER